MALTTTTPLAAPWTTSVTGTGTWDDLVTLIANTAKLSKDGSVYTIAGGLMLELRCTLTALTNCTVRWKAASSWCIASGGSVTFGKVVTNAAGVSVYTDGCNLIEESDAWSRGVNSYANENCLVRTGGSLTLYGSEITYLQGSATASHFDFKAGSFLTIRNSSFNSKQANYCFDHYAGNIDIIGFTVAHSNDVAGSMFELIDGATITNFSGFVPYLGSATARQCTFFALKAFIDQWGGDNFATWYTQGTTVFSDPKSMTLKQVDGQSTSSTQSLRETRTVQALALSGTTYLSGVQMDCINNCGWHDGNGTTDSGGSFKFKAVRGVWEHGYNTAYYNPYLIPRTPHVLHARKWGYKTASSIINVNPISYAQTSQSVIMPMVADPDITWTSSNAPTNAAAHTDVTITQHGRSVTWQGKQWGITIQANNTTSLSDLYQTVMYKCSELSFVKKNAAAMWTSGMLKWEYNIGTAGMTGGASDKTIVYVYSTGLSQLPPVAGSAQQYPSALGTYSPQMLCGIGNITNSSTNALVFRGGTSYAVHFQNYTTDLYADNQLPWAQASVTEPARGLYRNPQSGAQILICIGRYNASGLLVSMMVNGMDFGTQTVSSINFGTASQAKFGIGHVGTFENTWSLDQSQYMEGMVFDRYISDTERNNLNAYLANKWNMTAAMGNINNTTNAASTALTTSNYPVNGSGADWTPADFTTGQGAKIWFSLADNSAGTNYTVDGSNNITALKELVSGNNFTAASFGSTGGQTYTVNYHVYPRLLDDKFNSLASNFFADGIMRGVRVIDQSGNPFPGILSMQADDGTYYTSTQVTFTLSNLEIGSEVGIYKVSDGSLLASVETTIGTTFSYTYTYTADIPVIIVIFALDAQPIFLNATLSSLSSNIPVQQSIDRVYST